MKPDTKNNDRFIKGRRHSGNSKHGRLQKSMLHDVLHGGAEDNESLSSQSAMREKNGDWPGYTRKWVSNALYRFLDTQLGKPWNTVYSEVKERVKDEIDLKYLVDHAVEDTDGTKYIAGPFGMRYTLEYSSGRRSYYVDLDGTLRKAPKCIQPKRTKTKYFHIENNRDVYCVRKGLIFKFLATKIKTNPFFKPDYPYRGRTPTAKIQNGAINFGGDFTLNGEAIGNMVPLADLRQVSPAKAPKEIANLTSID